MKSLFILAILSLSATQAKAETIVCQFTEPFLTTTYNTTNKKLVVEGATPEESRIIQNVSFQIAGPAKFLLKNKGVVLATLDLTNNGSDGMSDTIYPYEVKFASVITGANSGVGGCSSDLLPVKAGN